MADTEKRTAEGTLAEEGGRRQQRYSYTFQVYDKASLEEFKQLVEQTGDSADQKMGSLITLMRRAGLDSGNPDHGKLFDQVDLCLRALFACVETEMNVTDAKLLKEKSERDGEKAALTATISDLKAQIAGMAAKATESEHEIDSYKQKISDLHDTLGVSRQNESDQKKTISELTDSLNNSKKLAQIYEADHVRVTELERELQDEKKNREKEQKDAFAEAQKASTAIRDLKEEIKDLKSQVIDTEKQAKYDRDQALLDAGKAHQAEIGQLQAAHREELKALQDEVEATRRKYSDDLEKYRKAADEWKDRYYETRNAAAELEKARETIAQLQNK